MQIQENISLKPFNTFGFDVLTRYFVKASCQDQLREAADFAHKQQLPILLLGGGSNIVLTQNFAGVAVYLGELGVEYLNHGEKTIVTAKAGENWHSLVRKTLADGVYGLENLSLIPGNVGAAPIQNIGAYGVELTDVFHSLTAIKLSTGESQTFTKQDCHFSYRDSVFKGELRDQYAITSVSFELSRSMNIHADYGALKPVLNALDCEITPQVVSDAVIAVRQSKLPDPDVLGNAGSFFKNPVVEQAVADELLANFPSMPKYEAGNGIKLAAGWLIDQCGYKGFQREGEGVGVHDKQALVLVNYGEGSGEKLLSLAREIQDTVQTRFGVALEVEPRIY